MEDTELGRYWLHEHLGRGSVARVYRATDSEKGRVVAIKVFDPGKRPPEQYRKLRDREVQMLVSVQHPNIVKFYESGEVDRTPYYTMEYVGDSLLKRMRDGTQFTLEDKVHILRQSVNALQAIHHQGIVHRDMKPGNMLLEQESSGAFHVKVTDLGIAKHVSETDVAQGKGKRRVPGTPKYLSPEQIELRPVDGRADIFSLGIVAYEFLSGQAPMRARTSEEFVKANLHNIPRPLHHVSPDLPLFLSRLVDKMLVKDREERYDSDTLGRDLELTYQHLVSDAPLVERLNPSSLFYLAPEPTAEETPAPRRAVPVPVLFAAGLLLLLGAACAGLLWPRAPAHGYAAGSADLSISAGLGATRAMDLAEDYATSGCNWEAFSLLGSLTAVDMSRPERTRWEDLLKSVGSRLALDDAQTGEAMVAGGRLDEARVVMERMHSLWPWASATVQLDARVRAVLQQNTWQLQWRDFNATVERQVSLGQYGQALADIESRLALPRLDQEQEDFLEGLAAAAFDAWGQDLLKAPTAPARSKQYFETLDRFRSAGHISGSFDGVSGQLRIKLARYYRDAGQYAEAAHYYGLVARGSEGPLAQTARAELAQVEQLLRSEPIDIALMAQKLQAEGFGSPVWRAITSDGGRQEVKNGALFIAQKGPAEGGVTARETEALIRSIGFTAAVKFKMRATGGSGANPAKAGIEVRDRYGTAATLFFDGSRYYVRMVTPLHSVESSVAEAAGDEGQVWHELKLRYTFETSSLATFLDGKQVGDYQADLDLFRLDVFVRAGQQGECSAWFKDIVCTP